jgi:uncharacterized protein YbjT (DUF2867 family)
MAAAARHAGVSRVIDMVMLESSLQAPTPRLQQNYLSEQIFESAGIGVAHVRATVFYENVRALTGWSLAANGTILLPWGGESTEIPLVSGEDVARVAVGLLAGPLGAARQLLSVDWRGPLRPGHDRHLPPVLGRRCATRKSPTSFGTTALLREV